MDNPMPWMKQWKHPERPARDRRWRDRRERIRWRNEVASWPSWNAQLIALGWCAEVPMRPMAKRTISLREYSLVLRDDGTVMDPGPVIDIGGEVVRLGKCVGVDTDGVVMYEVLDVDGAVLWPSKE